MSHKHGWGVRGVIAREGNWLYNPEEGKNVKNKAIIIFYPDCIEFEAIMAAQVLHGENLMIDVATPDGADYHGPSGIVLRATHSYADVRPEIYRVVIVPGGDTRSVLENETLLRFLKDANDAGAAFGAICAGPILLARAGLLRGRHFTHGHGLDFASPYWEGGIHEDRPVVVDGNIVTAQPQAYIDFAIEVLYAAGLRESWVFDILQQSGKSMQDLRAEIEAVKAHYRDVWGRS